MIEKVAYMNVLYDLYKSLLTEKQREYLELYYQEDWSLAEIAGELSVSRNAVHDNIKRTGKLLVDYEEKLGMYETARKRKHIYNEIKGRANGNDEIMHLLTQLEAME